MRLRFLLSAYLVVATIIGFAQTDSNTKLAPGFSIDNIDKTLDPVRRFLSVRLRQLAEDRGNSAGPELMGQLRRTG